MQAGECRLQLIFMPKLLCSVLHFLGGQLQCCPSPVVGSLPCVWVWEQCSWLVAVLLGYALQPGLRVAPEIPHFHSPWHFPLFQHSLALVRTMHSRAHLVCVLICAVGYDRIPGVARLLCGVLENASD